MKGRPIAQFITMLCLYAVWSAAQSSRQDNPIIVTGHPFSAVVVLTYQYGGSKSPTVTNFLQYDRDSEGRERRAKLDTLDDKAPSQYVNILDPVALRAIDLNCRTRKANVMLLQYPTMSAGADKNSKPADLADSPLNKEDPNRVDLGINILDGIKIHGYRWTSVEPGGGGVVESIRGSTQSTVPDSGVTTFETCYSPELKRIVIQNVRQGNGDESDMRYERITLGNPNSSKFLIPDGFQIVGTATQVNVP